MQPVEFLVSLLVATGCGTIGEAVAGASPVKSLFSLVLGFTGALLGDWLSAQISLPNVLSIAVGSCHYPIVWAFLGSAFLVASFSLFQRLIAKSTPEN